MEYKLKDKYIELFKLIKVLDLVDSGGEAKMIIASGHVKRNNEIETRKRAKIVSGDTIELAEVMIKVS